MTNSFVKYSPKHEGSVPQDGWKKSGQYGGFAWEIISLRP